MKTWLDIVKAKENEETSLHARQDLDRDFRNRKEYTMKTLDGKKVAPKIANVTLPEPSLFMAKTIARVASAERQPYILANKRDMSGAETTRIEEYVEDMEYEIDAFLNEKGERASKDFQADIACSRGRVAKQILTRWEDGEYIPDVRDLDTRYFSSQPGPKGMLWGAPKFWRTGEWLEEDYPKEMLKIGLTGNGTKEFLVRDVWTKKTKDREAENIIYVDDQELRREKSSKVLGYPIDYPPFTFQIVPAGSVLKDKDSLKYTGESVFEILRAVFDEDNFVASTLKTLNYGLFKPPVQIARKDGIGNPPQDYVGDPGTMTIVETPGAIQPVFMPDIKAFTARYDSKIRQIMDKAGYSSVDYGQTTEVLSFIAMTLLAQGKRELLLPRLKALSLLSEASYRMIIRQFLAIGETVELGELGHRREYSPSQLEGKYKIKFRFFPNTKDELAANAALAGSMGDDIPEDYKWREIYKFADPDGMKKQRDVERAEAGSKVLQLYNQCKSLIGQKREDEAEALFIDLRTLILQKRMAALTGQVEEQPPEVKPKKVQQLLPMFGSGSPGVRE